MSENMSNPNYEEILKQGRTLGSIIDLESELSRAENIENHYNTPFRIHSIENRQGQSGEYIVMSATNLVNLEEIKLSTGAIVINRIMDKINKANKFPVDCAFHLGNDGRTKLVRDVVPQDFD